MTNSRKRLRPIWLDENERTVKIIDQRYLPHRLEIVDLNTPEDTIRAIGDMMVRGAPLIGVTAAYGVFLSLVQCESGDQWRDDCQGIRESRPTAVNLQWAVDRMVRSVDGSATRSEQIHQARRKAGEIAEEEVSNCRQIGHNGLPLIEKTAAEKNGETVNILTHCNAGWLACVEYGTATAPMYVAHAQGIDIHIWVDETRPLNQGARLTAWELARAGVPHTVITDNAGGHLMQEGKVDMVIVGTDRTTRTGDVANKIGTYLKALAAKDNEIPFYVALPSSTFDWERTDGLRQIPIELRDENEVRFIQGVENNIWKQVLVPPPDSPTLNPAFDVTPARLVTAFITERGICGANEKEILSLFPEKAPQ